MPGSEGIVNQWLRLRARFRRRARLRLSGSERVGDQAVGLQLALSYQRQELAKLVLVISVDAGVRSCIVTCRGRDMYDALQRLTIRGRLPLSFRV